MAYAKAMTKSTKHFSKFYAKWETSQSLIYVSYHPWLSSEIFPGLFSLVWLGFLETHIEKERVDASKLSSDLHKHTCGCAVHIDHLNSTKKKRHRIIMDTKTGAIRLHPRKHTLPSRISINPKVREGKDIPSQWPQEASQHNHSKVWPSRFQTKNNLKR